MVYFLYRFEFDSAKSTANREKHGIDFNQAQALWYDPSLLQIPARSVDEPRSLFIGKIAGVSWSAVVTFRAGRIRIISVRRSNSTEVTLYEEN